MNNFNGQHLSASQRRILALETELARFEAMKAEFLALLHYLIATHSGHFDVERERLKALQTDKTLHKGIQSVIMKRDTDGKDVMRYTAIEPSAPSLIILPK